MAGETPSPLEVQQLAAGLDQAEAIEGADVFVSTSSDPVAADLVPKVDQTQNVFNFRPPATVVEVISPARKPLVGGERFGRKSTDVEGVELIIEHGTDPQFSSGRIKRLQADTDRIARYRGVHVPEFEAARERLIEAAGDQEGFRGVVSHRGTYEAPLVPVEKNVEYDPELLKESTGDLHPLLVREEGRIIIDMPFNPDMDARDQIAEFAEVIGHLMVDLYSRKPSEVRRMIRQVLVQRLDEQLLNRKIAEGAVELLPGTRTSEETYATPINPMSEATTPNRQRRLARKSSKKS